MLKFILYTIINFLFTNKVAFLEHRRFSLFWSVTLYYHYSLLSLLFSSVTITVALSTLIILKMWSYLPYYCLQYFVVLPRLWLFSECWVAPLLFTVKCNTFSTLIIFRMWSSPVTVAEHRVPFLSVSTTLRFLHLSGHDPSTEKATCHQRHRSVQCFPWTSFLWAWIHNFSV